MTSVRSPFHQLAVLALLALSLMLLLGKTDQRTLQAMDSSVHARLALDVTRDGLKPSLPISPEAQGGHWAQGFNDHPFTLFYLNGWVMRALGPSAWSARVLPALLGVGCVYLTYVLGLTLGLSAIGAWGAAAVLALSPQFIGYAGRFHLDAPMLFFILLSFVAWARGRPKSAGAFAALGMCVKSPVALLIYPAALLGAPRRDAKLWRSLAQALGITMALTGCFWTLTAWLGGWDLVQDYWTRQVFGTLALARGGEPTPTVPLLGALTLKWLLWLPLLVLSLVRFKKQRALKKPGPRLVLAAAGIVLLAISAMRFKYEHYYLPVYPFLALIVAMGIEPELLRHQERIEKSALAGALIALAILLASPIELGPEKFPALRRFDAIVQSQGSCRDRALYIEGAQPYGSFGDYRALFTFYTNRPLEGVSCDKAAARIDALAPRWIIVSGGEARLDQCIGTERLRRYPTRYRYGEQFLLSTQALGSTLDLTALARELAVTADCEPSAVTQDRYSPISATR